MNLNYLIKQPWFQAIVAFVIVVSLGVTIYFLGKSAARKEWQNERNAIIAKQNKEVANLQNLAAKYRATSDLYKRENDELKVLIAEDRKNAESIAIKIEKENLERKEQIEKDYEQTKKSINNMSDCDRCVDICKRANALADTYGGFFEDYRCNPESECSKICNSE